jgi:HflK protein
MLEQDGSAPDAASQHDDGPLGVPEPNEEGESVSWSDLALIAFVAVMLLLNVTGLFTQLFGIDTALLVTIAGGYGIFWDSLSRLRRGKIGGDLAVTIAAFAALAIGQYVAAAEVVLIMLVGTALESFAVRKTRGAIAALLELAPPTACVLRDGREVILPVEQVQSGDRVIIRPGERIPVDGMVRSGQSAVDQAALTGEPMPVPRCAGDPVYAGTINTLGLLEAEAEAVGPDTTLAQIVRLVEEAEGRKAPVERLADRWAGYFVPLVLALGALTFAFWFLLLRAPFEVAITRMAAALIIACPCALILATPTAIAAAIGRCARRGILARGGACIEAMARVDCVVFDKTGTLTAGRPEVADVVPLDGRSRAEALRLAAAAEQGSAHPIAGAVLAAHRDGPLPPLAEAEFRPGLGMVAWLAGSNGPADRRRVMVGNRQLLAAGGVSLAPEVEVAAREMEAQGRTAVFVAEGAEPVGLLAVEDPVRPEASAVVAGLRDLGIRRVVMLSGDSEPAAAAAARRAGIDEVAAGLFPADKVMRLRALQAEGYLVAMVGDGINDAPSLAAAEVGVAMGRGAADIAVEAADVVFVADDLARLPESIVISRRALQTIRRSIAWFAIGLNGVSVLASASGALAWIGYRLQEIWPLLFGSAGRDLSPVLAAVEHQIASLLVVGSSLRLLAGGPAWRPGETVRGLPGRPESPRGPTRLGLAGTPAGRWLARAPEGAARFAHQYQRPLMAGAAILAAALWLLSGTYLVPAGQVGVVQRFGRLAATVMPGLHYHLPWPAEGVTLVDVAGVRRAEIGFRSARPQTAGRLAPGGAVQDTVSELPASEWNTQHAGSMRRVAEESLLLTGDEYLVDANLTLQYRVRDPARFLFRVSDAEAALRQAGEAALRRAAERTPLESLLTTGRAAVEARILAETQASSDRFDNGLVVVSARLQEVHPPQEVVGAYRDVSSASEEKVTAINQAEAYRNETVPLAHGQAAQNIALASGYTFDRIRRASGQADRFIQAVNGYHRGEEVNAGRLYLETVEQALAAPAKFILDPAGGGRRQMWLVDGQLFGLPGLPAPSAAPESRSPVMPPSEEGQ